jgi:hypothetical protein
MRRKETEDLGYLAFSIRLRFPSSNLIGYQRKLDPTKTDTKDPSISDGATNTNPNLLPNN